MSVIPDVIRKLDADIEEYKKRTKIGVFTLVMIIGFLPPSQLEMGSYANYLTFLVVGIVAACLAPFIMYGVKQSERSN